MNNLVLYIILCFGAVVKGYAQQNLVPNPSFESPFDCCQTENSCASWSSYSESPDYFNSCNSSWCSNFSTPNNSFGFQSPRNGNGYYGLVTYVEGSEFHEIIGTTLTTNLTIGTKYYVSMYVSLAEDLDQSELVGGASDKLGMLFTTSSYSTANPIIPENFAHFYTSTIITDTANWIKIQGSFIADSSYTHLAIGNFYDTTNTNTANINGSVLGSYYFIEDVCVSSDSLTCITPAGVLFNSTKDKFKVFIVENDLIVNSTHNSSFNVSIFDITGKLIHSSFNQHNSFQYNTSQLSSNIYFVRVLNKTESFSSKIFINP